MNKITSSIVLLIILGIVFSFHLFIYFEFIPYDIVWAGKINSIEEMKRFELVSILINAFISLITFIKYKQLKLKLKNKVIDILIWCFVILFSLNTIGNLFAETLLEFILGTALTLSLAYLYYVIARNKQ